MSVIWGYSFKKTAWKATRVVLLFFAAVTLWTLEIWIGSFFTTWDRRPSALQVPAILWCLEAARDWRKHRLA